MSVALRYVAPWEMRDTVLAHASRGGRAWRYAKKWRSCRPNGIGRIKIRFAPLDEIGAVRESLARRPKLFGKDPGPSSWAWPWLKVHSPPRPAASLLAVIDPRFSLPRAWNEAVRPGNFRGEWNVYDLRSAYAWAGMTPLPDVRRTIYRDRVPRPDRSARDGLYLVNVSRWGVALVPPRLRTDRPVWVTREELEHYDPHGATFHRAAEWKQTRDLRPTFDLLRETLPAFAFKRLCRAYWGNWMSGERVEEWSLSNEISLSRLLPARFHCPPWAWIILARVGIRCSEVPDALHVFTDSVITRKNLIDGGRLGDWKRERILLDPWIVAAGVYGDETGPLKHAGVTRENLDATLRYRMRADAAQKRSKESKRRIDEDEKQENLSR